jgi:hypothetical protein
VEPFGTFVHLDGLCRLVWGHVDGVRGAAGGGGRIFDVFRPNISEDAHRGADLSPPSGRGRYDGPYGWNAGMDISTVSEIQFFDYFGRKTRGDSYSRNRRTRFLSFFAR